MIIVSAMSLAGLAVRGEDPSPAFTAFIVVLLMAMVVAGFVGLWLLHRKDKR